MRLFFKFCLHIYAHSLPQLCASLPWFRPFPKKEETTSASVQKSSEVVSTSSDLISVILFSHLPYNKTEIPRPPQNDRGDFSDANRNHRNECNQSTLLHKKTAPKPSGFGAAACYTTVVD